MAAEPLQDCKLTRLSCCCAHALAPWTRKVLASQPLQCSELTVSIYCKSHCCKIPKETVEIGV